MSSEPQPLEDIFAFALRIPEPTARAAYLARACGEDAALRAEVESLIAADEAADGFMRAVNHAESWIPAEDVEELNNNIVGLIEVIREFRKEEPQVDKTRPRGTLLGRSRSDPE